jgi:hypothetical protein
MKAYSSTYTVRVSVQLSISLPFIANNNVQQQYMLESIDFRLINFPSRLRSQARNGYLMISVSPRTEMDSC